MEFSTTLAAVTCYKCGMLFAMPEHYQAQLLKNHQGFFCPAGHEQFYLGQTEAEKLRDQVAREKHWREQAEARVRDQRLETERITRRLNATRGVVTRHKRKIAAGKCPCCSAAFKDLAAHMKNRHPNWNPEKEAEVRANV